MLSSGTTMNASVRFAERVTRQPRTKLFVIFQRPSRSRTVGRESDLDRFLGTKVFVLPEVAEVVAVTLEAQILGNLGNVRQRFYVTH